VYQGSSSVDHRGEVSVGFLTSHGDSFELFDFGEEVFDEMAPLVHDFVDLPRLSAPRSLRNDNLGAARVHFRDDPVRVKSLVRQQGVKANAIDQRCDANRIVPIAGQQPEADKIAKGVGQGEDFGRPAALRFADGLILSPPFAP
jgi:hypothetical protein